MYQIKCDGYVLYDPRIEDLCIISPKCSLQLRKTGLLTFQVHPTHPYYDKIKKHVSEITLYQDDTVLFCGRVLNDEIDFYNIKNIECEGDLSYFLDSIQRGKEYHLEGGEENVIKTYLKDLVNIHNSQVDDRKKFTVGTVTVADPNNYLYKISTYTDTLTCLNEKLIGTYGGYFQIRYENDGRYIDYLAQLEKACTQTIEFGKNLIDMSKHIKGEDIFTALIPLGAKIEDEVEVEDDTEGDIEIVADTEDSTPGGNVLERFVDISSVADTTDGTIVKTADYIYDSEAVQKYGWIWKTEKWDDVTVPDNLYSKAKTLLKNSVNETLTLELTAIDLHLLDVDIDKISLGDKIQAVSIPHNLNEIMIVEKMDIDIENPQNTKITLILPENFISKDVSYSNGKKTSDKEIKDVKDLIADKLVEYDDLKALDDKYFKIDKVDDMKSVEELKAWTDDTHLKISPTDDIKSVEELKAWADDTHLKISPADEIKSVDELKTWVDDTHLQVSPADDIKSVSDMKNWVTDNFSGGGTIDLSEYAKVVDVNNAFNQLASALGGI